MRSKPLSAALAVLLLLLLLSACDGRDTPADTPEITADTETPASPEETTEAPTEAPTTPPDTEPPTEAVTEQETFLPDDPNADYVYIKVQNPIHEGGCDPWVYLHEGSYYYCYSRGRGISVAKMSSLHTLVPKGTAVFDPPKWTEYSEELWAPELHYLNGEWYIYVAASDGYSSNHRMFVLKGTSQNPRGRYEMVGQITDPSNKWAIDGTVMELNGELYFLWSGWEGDKDGKQNLYIAHMSDPCTIDSERVMISTPEHNWETVEWPDVNEGPTVLQHGGKTFVVYSASGSWGDYYCLGMLTLTGEDPMDPASWTKESRPVFTRRTDVCYGPGHCSFSTAVDGSVWMIYHGNQVSDTGWDGRSVWIAPVTFDEDGTPHFGRPEPEVLFPVPKG
jgi:GH43 family beta-xylosidase